ncbi:sugar transferase [Jonesia denitrificans]|uniref:Exopolysaccharide biosynthesis polyprenyl glycosylphosphotransferase n=1 Tax=Jonesia denitrificans (strain ATCC 14870 / DSM 20603 / BCRC 15368 / CIP 55.134 / JCM 11481 / NBRC 15587 / NCTC 10816 / Prevot 55134) TaxID=471856 RepID=C7R4U1_JONDD|nr:sugar transferase [Jonesia denitrificans]ACV07714.1 exopolysaccharide biosynthesis polyprenyl glycosylphosphotransferase [Jonesia denitrificans DSM 20603]ASE08563.1 sugar transferase [Jonesia denitrificans]QXB43171.1 sugar transferase [Jonesia denitrificans]SQH19682.1 Putative colanic biosynthesis UDP-glucose lipid carrier transferase [Jonesia denitrificans]
MALLTASPREKVDRWQHDYAQRLFLSDLTVIAVCVFGAQLLRFGTSMQELSVESADRFSFVLSYSTVSLVLIFGWMLALQYFDTRDYRITGTGPEEYKRILDTSVRVFGLLAIIDLLTRASIARGYLLIALPSGLFFLLLTRWLWRKWLHKQRAEGQYLHKAVIVGDYDKIKHVADEIGRSPANGYALVGAVSTTKDGKDLAVAGVAVQGNYDAILTTVEGTGADTLIMTSADVLGPKKMRRLGWELEQRGIEMVVAPALTDVAGPRIHMRPVAGLPLIHVDFPQFSGQKYWMKRAFDVVGSAFLIVVLSPIMVTVAVLVKRDSPGPVLFRQGRIGHNQEPFKMLKFRSMAIDAEAKLAEFLDRNDGNGVLFKLKDDPRVTRVGRVLRRYSLDELPQLFNVLKGDMSLVGPRPPLPVEVEKYDDHALRRLLVKPGITGLWQVSGRSDLSWDDSVRLDLYYVENWSMMSDIIILYRTIRTVVTPSGAY